MVALTSLLRCRRGSSAAEMALVMPLLTIILFGSVELGNYFWYQHVVQKGVRDGARYATREPVAAYTCPGGGVDSAAATRIKSVTRTGVLAGGTTRVPGWDDTEVTVSVDCQSGTPAGVYASGIYSGLPGGARKVTVSASVPYQSLWADMVYPAANIKLGAISQAAVFGI
ncbi:TadE/TadG family type IV pilus assembly protein [Sphingomonas sp. GCM10030256]|uniref:TadE/TadG family type IV pilus assembly protein n=1 Tax=Sphingomonas sp. GCM10030256 TaxID=3273427 RepID=UPI0036202F04